MFSGRILPESGKIGILRANIHILLRPFVDMGRTTMTGSEVLQQLAGKDLNNDGKVINLVICGNSKFYDYGFLEDELDTWVKYNGYPDVVILGGASGVDYLAERWADNNNIPLAIFTEAWAAPRPSKAEDTGRPQAVADLGKRMIKHATHMLAFPGPDSVWTKHMEKIASDSGVPVVSVTLPMD